ncbi:MAG: hypothetical protein ACI8QC_004175, partial [Planctomycetota bacterium]
WMSRAVTRGGGEFGRGVSDRAGDEFLYDLGDAGWGYVRILGFEEGTARLEIAPGIVGRNQLRRDPARLHVQAVGGGHQLEWAAEKGAQYWVRRRVVGDGAEEEVARVNGGRWIDVNAPEGVLVEYRVARVSGSGWGARARSVQQAQLGEWPLELRVGQRIDLLTGAEGVPSAQVEVTHASPPSVTLRVVGEALLTPINSYSGAAKWELPDLGNDIYTKKLRSLNEKGELGFYLPGPGIYGRLRVTSSEPGSMSLLRQVDWSGRRMLPRPPVMQSGRPRWTGTELRLQVTPPAPTSVPHPEHLSVVVEREVEYLTGSWEELAVFPADERELVLDLDPATGTLLRLRLRHRYAWGTGSHAGEPVSCLLVDEHNPQDLNAALDRAMGDLGHPLFARRREARGVLSLLGSAAWPRLQAALSGDQAEVVASARELLLDAEGDSGAHLEFVLRARAADLGVRSDPPPGLFSEDFGERAHALLLFWPQPGGTEWVRVMALGDPDESVRELAQLLSEAPVLPRMSTGLPYVLTPKLERKAQAARDWREYASERGPVGLSLDLRSGYPPMDARSSLARLRLAFDLSPADERGWEGPGGGAERAELVLRLVDRYSLSGEEALLRAAEVLVSGPAAMLGAGRELLYLRLGGSPPELGRRRRLEVERADLALLEVRIGALLEAGESYVDLVLPPGDYHRDGSGDNWLDIRVPGLRLIGGQGVHLDVGLRVQGAQDVVLEGLAVGNGTGSALLVVDGSVTAVDCEFVGNQSVVSLQNSELDLDRCRVLTLPGTQGLYSVRFSAASSLRARATRLAAGTLYLGDGGRANLDRCVLESGVRALVQGQRDGQLVARDCLLRGGNVGLYGLEQGLLEGVVLRAAQDPFGRGNEWVRFCAEHTRHHGTPSARSSSGDPLLDCPARASLGPR